MDRIEGDAAIEARLEPNSLDWVRSGRLLAVPRAVLIVTAPSAKSGLVTYAGVTHPMTIVEGKARAEVPVALLSGGALPIRVRTVGPHAQSAVFAVRFAPRPEQHGRVVFDSTCSPYGLRVRAGALPADSWLQVGCRLLHTARDDYQGATLELIMLWDHTDGPVSINGVDSEPTKDAFFTYRTGAQPGHLRLGARGAEIVLEYRIPERLHDGFLGVGLGPYYYALEDNLVDFETAAPMLTLYAGYSLNPTARIVYFNATLINRHGYSDQGLYIWFEQARMFDQRLALNFLLGANVLIYERDNAAFARFSVPQGFELVFRDFLRRSYNLTGGAFIYPKIFGRSYYNLWLRWGTPALFGEINYIDWHEPPNDAPSQSRSLGFTFGTTLLKFL